MCTIPGCSHPWSNCLCVPPPPALQEFQPWLKWIIFDAALTLLVGQLVKRVEFVRPLFEAVGWA
jgi:hypothetical protein